MRSGALDRRIVIQRSTPAQDAFGQPVDSWSTHATVWARIRRDGVEEAGAEPGGEARQARVRARFEIRWSSDVSDVTASDRVSFDGAIWDVVGVEEIGRRVGLRLLAVARGD